MIRMLVIFQDTLLYTTGLAYVGFFVFVRNTQTLRRYSYGLET